MVVASVGSTESDPAIPSGTTESMPTDAIDAVDDDARDDVDAYTLLGAVDPPFARELVGIGEPDAVPPLVSSSTPPVCMVSCEGGSCCCC